MRKPPTIYNKLGLLLCSAWNCLVLVKLRSQKNICFGKNFPWLERVAVGKTRFFFLIFLLVGLDEAYIPNFNLILVFCFGPSFNLAAVEVELGPSLTEVDQWKQWPLKFNYWNGHENRQS